MNYRYRVKGIAEKAFILRGMHFRIGGKIDTDIFEKELSFVKENCKISEIIDMESRSQTSQPIPTNSQKTAKGVKNELSKPSGANKGTNKAKV